MIFIDVFVIFPSLLFFSETLTNDTFLFLLLLFLEASNLITCLLQFFIMLVCHFFKQIAMIDLQVLDLFFKILICRIFLLQEIFEFFFV